MLPKTASKRKQIPIATGMLDYFPDAIAAVAAVSYIGNEQHNPGTPCHWDRSKSGDEADALMRHFMERGTLDSDGTRHSAKMAWRALALLQKEIEAERTVQVTEGDGRTYRSWTMSAEDTREMWRGSPHDPTRDPPPVYVGDFKVTHPWREFPPADDKRSWVDLPTKVYGVGGHYGGVEGDEGFAP
jgi:hypothetical protein